MTNHLNVLRVFICFLVLALYLLAPSAANLCKQIGTRSGPHKMSGLISIKFPREQKVNNYPINSEIFIMGFIHAAV